MKNTLGPSVHWWLEPSYSHDEYRVIIARYSGTAGCRVAEYLTPEGRWIKVAEGARLPDRAYALRLSGPLVHALHAAGLPMDRGAIADGLRELAAKAMAAA